MWDKLKINLFIGTWIILATLCLLLPGRASADDALEKRPCRVLIVSTFHLNHPWTADFNSKLIRDLNESGLGFSVDFLELNAIQRRNIDFAAKFEPYLASIKNREYDVVVAILGDAIKVVEDNYGDFPKDLPVFCARDQVIAPGYQERYPSITGTQNDMDVFRNVEVGLSIIPNTTGALIITDDIDSGLELYEKLKVNKNDFTKCKLEIINSADYDTPKMLKKVASLPPDWFVVFTPWRNFVKDGFFSLEQVAGELQACTPNPYFVTTSVLVGRGALGGYVSRGETHGRIIAEQMLKVINGEKPNNINFVYGPRELMVDMNVMRQYNLPVNYLPKDPFMINRRMPFYEEYRIESISVLVAFSCILLLLIFVHLHHRGFQRMSSQNNFLLNTGGSMALVSYFCGDLEGKVCLIGGNKEIGIPNDGKFYPIQEWVIPEEREAFNSAKESIVKGDTQDYKGFFHSRWSGKKRSYQLLVSSCLYGGKYLVVLRDITDVESADRAQSYFWATLSHEIRTPMNAIVGFAELLQDCKLSAKERQEYASAIRSSGNVLLTLINDVLDLAKLESGQLTVALERCSIDQLVQEVLSVYHVAAGQKGIFLKLVSHVDFTIYLDRVRVRQLLVNLVGNAVNSTSKGGVTLVADFYLDDANSGRLELVVIDSGCGISESGQGKLFNPFAPQSNSEPREKYSSDGLGLVICYRMLEHIGGLIEVKSEIGEGSEFKITLNHVKYDLSKKEEQPQELPTATDQVKPTPKLTVLAADDIELNVKLLCAMLRRQGVEVEGALSGEEALKKLETFRPDLVLTDMWMPGMNGAELAAEIKRNKELAGVKIYALTADCDAALNFSMENIDGILFKPISITQLNELFLTIEQAKLNYHKSADSGN